nr:hypothetical protein [Tanacetum cinerariifolium]
MSTTDLQVVGRQQLDLPPIKLSEVGQKEEDEEECVTTPTSPESKIPIVAKHDDEIDHFFKSTYELINTNSSKKRRCPQDKNRGHTHTIFFLSLSLKNQERNIKKTHSKNFSAIFFIFSHIGSGFILDYVKSVFGFGAYHVFDESLEKICFVN